MRDYYEKDTQIGYYCSQFVGRSQVTFRLQIWLALTLRPNANLAVTVECVLDIVHSGKKRECSKSLM